MRVLLKFASNTSKLMDEDWSLLEDGDAELKRHLEFNEDETQGVTIYATSFKGKIKLGWSNDKLTKPQDLKEISNKEEFIKYVKKLSVRMDLNLKSYK